MNPERIRNALVWRGGMAVDADGSPNAYGPHDSGLDRTANAGGPGHWYGVLVGPDGNPVVQGPGDPCPGDYIATTALQDHGRAITDPRRYVDSRVVPYVVVTRDLRELGLQLADVCMVLYRGRQCAAVVGDVGPHLGEGSIALADALGIPSSPRHGGVESGVTYVAFPRSSRGWPRTMADVKVQAAALFDGWGRAAAVA